MSVFVNDGGIEKEAKMIYVNDGGIDKPVLGGGGSGTIYDYLVDWVVAGGFNNLDLTGRVEIGDVVVMTVSVNNADSLVAGWERLQRGSSSNCLYACVYDGSQQLLFSSSGQSSVNVLIFRGVSGIGQTVSRIAATSTTSVSFTAVSEAQEGSFILYLLSGSRAIDMNLSSWPSDAHLRLPLSKRVFISLWPLGPEQPTGMSITLTSGGTIYLYTVEVRV